MYKHVYAFQKLLSDSQKGEDQFESLDNQAQSIGHDHDQLEVLLDLRTRYGQLTVAANDTVVALLDIGIARKQLEADMLKVDLWWKDTDTFCAIQLNFDIPIEQLHHLFNKYQVISLILSRK